MESTNKVFEQQSNKIVSAGTKYDDGKLRMDLIPSQQIEGLASVFTMGARKYEDRNWERGMKWSKVFRAMLGHAWAFWRGERYDPEDGQHHMVSAVWCALALLCYDLRGIGDDNRPVLEVRKDD